LNSLKNFWILGLSELFDGEFVDKEIRGFNSLMPAASMDLSVAEAVCKVCLSSTDFGTPFCFKKESEIRQLGIRLLTGLRTSNLAQSWCAREQHSFDSREKGGIFSQEDMWIGNLQSSVRN
jgi:hypothetical protein